jgi:hypothetical protein
MEPLFTRGWNVYHIHMSYTTRNVFSKKKKFTSKISFKQKGERLFLSSTIVSELTHKKLKTKGNNHLAKTPIFLQIWKGIQDNLIPFVSFWYNMSTCILVHYFVIIICGHYNRLQMHYIALKLYHFYYQLKYSIAHLVIILLIRVAIICSIEWFHLLIQT